jgi:hypothetical protein
VQNSKNPGEMKASELKEALSGMGLSQQGLKEVLHDRLKEAPEKQQQRPSTSA